MATPIGTIRLRCSCGSEDIEQFVAANDVGEPTTRVRCKTCGFEGPAPTRDDAIQAGAKALADLLPKPGKKRL